MRNPQGHRVTRGALADGWAGKHNQSGFSRTHIGVFLSTHVGTLAVGLHLSQPVGAVGDHLNGSAVDGGGIQGQARFAPASPAQADWRFVCIKNARLVISDRAFRPSTNPRVASEGPQALRLLIENRRHVRRFSCDFVRNRFLTRTNGRENGLPFDQ